MLPIGKPNYDDMQRDEVLDFKVQTPYVLAANVTIGYRFGRIPESQNRYGKQKKRDRR